MASLSSKVNWVSIDFDPNVVNDVDQKLVEALNQVIRTGIPLKYTIRSLTISAMFDSHDKPSQKDSRHNQQKAIDISMINNKPVNIYKNDPEVAFLSDFIQNEFEKVAGRRENFGPLMTLKLGRPFKPPGRHDNHIHLSVD